MSTEKKLIAVTGASGFIGAYVVKYLLERGYRVRALVRDPSNESKIKYLRAIDEKNIEFGGGDLEKANYEELFKDCYSVIHIATAYIHTAPNPYEDIVLPAVNGTLRVLEAASKVSTIRKVIVTSSAGAIINSLNPNVEPLDEYNEECWNTTSTLENGPYFYAKVTAEKAAWNFHKENESNPATNHFELSVICPTFVIGPTYSSELNTSLKMVIRILTEKAPIPPTRVGIVDVRDAALAHILVLESTLGSQRYLVGSSVQEFKDIVTVSKKLYPEGKFQTTELPPTLVKEWRLNTTKIQSQGLTKFIPFEQSIKDMIEKLKSDKNINI